MAEVLTSFHHWFVTVLTVNICMLYFPKYLHTHIHHIYKNILIRYTIHIGSCIDLENYHSGGSIEKIDKSALFQTPKLHSAGLKFINDVQWLALNHYAYANK